MEAANFLSNVLRASLCTTKLAAYSCKSPTGFLPELLILSPSQLKEGEKAETSIVSLSRTTVLSFFFNSLLGPVHPVPREWAAAAYQSPHGGEALFPPGSQEQLQRVYVRLWWAQPSPPTPHGVKLFSALQLSWIVM